MTAIIALAFVVLWFSFGYFGVCLSFAFNLQDNCNGEEKDLVPQQLFRIAVVLGPLFLVCVIWFVLEELVLTNLLQKFTQTILTYLNKSYDFAKSFKPKGK